MNYEQTKELFLNIWNTNAYIGICESSDMKNIIRALDKQIPKKPNYNKLFGRYECPSCYKQREYMDMTFCGMCGQLLDWS